MNPVAIRLLNQQLIAPQFSRPEEVVNHFGAMQAQEYRMMRWAVEMRTKRPFQPVIAHDGIICGNWSPFKYELETSFFIEEHKGDCSKSWEKYYESRNKAFI